jgi:hypothetical protein
VLQHEDGKTRQLPKGPTVFNSTLIRAFLISASAIACVQAADLRPDQQAALDKVLSAMDPSMREMVRPQLEITVQSMTPEQLNLFVKSATGNSSNSNPEPAQEEPEKKASPDRRSRVQSRAVRAHAA